MKSIPRILPLVGVAIGGVLAVNALSGARDLPDLLSGAKAFAEGAAKPVKGAKEKPAKDATADATKSADPAQAGADTGLAADASAALPPPSIAPKPVCAPTAAELAKQAGLSPAELQVLQNLGARRGQLDQRESDLNTQLALMAAAEAKVDAKLKAMDALKGQIQGLLSQADAKQAEEIDRLVKVFEGMKPKDAAPRFAMLDDSVRLPIAAKMKERSLSAIVAQMPATEAKKLTEALAKRYSDAIDAANKADQAANNAQPAPQAAADPTQPAKAAKPVKSAANRKASPRKKAPANQQAAAAKAPAAPAAASPAAGAPPAAAPAKSG